MLAEGNPADGLLGYLIETALDEARSAGVACDAKAKGAFERSAAPAARPQGIAPAGSYRSVVQLLALECIVCVELEVVPLAVVAANVVHFKLTIAFIPLHFAA